MVEETFNPVRRLLFTRVQPSPQQSPRTPFDRSPDTHGKDISSGEVLPVCLSDMEPTHLSMMPCLRSGSEGQRQSRLTSENACSVMQSCEWRSVQSNERLLGSQWYSVIDTACILQILATLRRSESPGKASLPSKGSVSGPMTPPKPPGLAKTDSTPPAPKSPGPFSFIKKLDSLQSFPSLETSQVSQQLRNWVIPNGACLIRGCLVHR